MAFKVVSDLSADTTISLGGVNRKTNKANPSKIEGYYLGKREVADNKKKSGKSYIYILQTPKGNVGVWGKTDMDRKMNSAQLGAMTRISHVGMVKTPNGDMYKYEVAVDSDNTIEVSDVGGQETQAESNDEGYESAAETETQEEEIDEEAAAAELAALDAAAQARRAKVQALLTKKK